MYNQNHLVKIRLLIITVLIIALASPLQAASQSLLIDEQKINKTIDSYFKQREIYTINPKFTHLQNDQLQYSVKGDISEFEFERMNKYRLMEEKLNIIVLQAKTTKYLNKIVIDKDFATAFYYEWITMDYKGLNGALDYMGMGTWHKISLVNENNEWLISDVSYDEGPLTNVVTADIMELYNDPFFNVQVNNEEFNSTNTLDENDISYHPSIISKIKNGDSTIQSNYAPYDRDGVAKYADKWVKPGISGTIDEDFYNPKYKNFNPNGGDCANYVSQAMYEGGTLPMVGKATRSKANGAWWYDNRGTSSTADDLVSENWSWTSAQNHRTHIRISYGTSTKDNPTSSDIIKGNPVYYDWNGNGTYNHVTIAVGTNSSGVPVVNSHNNDYYRVHWNYGGANAKYSTVKIVNEYECTICP